VIEPIKPNVFACLALRNSANLRILKPDSGAKRMMLWMGLRGIQKGIGLIAAPKPNRQVIEDLGVNQGLTNR
jgi:hypothetical protein